MANADPSPAATAPAAPASLQLRVRQVWAQWQGSDDLGLRHGLGDRMLPLLVAAMAFLAAMALAGALAAAALAQHWQGGAEASLTVQVPHPEAALQQKSGGATQTRLDGVLALLRSSHDVARAHALDAHELSELLRPWLGVAAESAALPLPAVIEVHLVAGVTDAAALGRALDRLAPGTLTESHDVWSDRLQAMARSLQQCAWVVVGMVIGVLIAVVVMATRAGLSARRDAIEIVYGLGATNGYIAWQFSRHIAGLSALGGVLGAMAADPVLIVLSRLAAPFAADGMQQGGLSALPARMSAGWPIWTVLLILPLGSGMLGYLTAQATVRGWLRALP